MRKIFIFLAISLLPLFISSCADFAPSKSFDLFSSNEIKLTLTISGVGKGKVFLDSGDFSCDRTRGSCTTSVKSGSALTFTAKPDPGYLFLGWYGENCRGGLNCQITIDRPQEIKAAFGMVAYLSSANPFSDTNKQTNRSFGHLESNPVFNLWIATTDGKTNYPVTQLTKANSQFPKWSPDGTQLVYQSSRAFDGSDQEIGKSNLWIINADGSENRALTQSTEADSYLPQWSPDGKKIIYGSFRALDGTDRKNEVSNLWIINTDGSNPTPLTKLTKAGSYEPQWSPDGKQVVYESARALDGSDHSNQHYNIWISSSDGSNPRPLTKSTQADSYLPQWSPDGSKVAYQSFLPLDEKNEKNNFSNLWIIHSDGSNNRPVTQLTQAGSYSVQWSSDGNQIFYESSRALDGTDQNNGHYNIWVSNMDGSNPQPLTRLTEADNFVPQRSADGNYLIYASSRSLDGSNSDNNHLSNIWMMNLENSENRPLTQSQNAHSFLQLIAE